MKRELLEKLVISEINDFRRISGLPLLNEGGKSDIARGAIRLIDNAFGITSKSVDVLSREVGADAARLLKKLADPNDTTPIITIIDDLMSANKTVGRNVYTQLRNHLDTIVDGTGKSLRDKLDEISAKSKQMIQDGSTVDEAAEYFETETKRILDDSTDDEELISTITKYEKDINRDWFPATTSSRTAGDTNTSTNMGAGQTSPPPPRIPSFNELVRGMTQEEANQIFESFEKKEGWDKLKSFTENLLKRVKNLFDKGKVLEEETIKLITSLRKTEDSTLEDQIVERIIKNMGQLKDINSKTYKMLSSWMSKQLGNSSDRGVRELYQLMTKNPEWGKVVAATPLWERFLKGFTKGIVEFGESSKNLRNAWLKYIAKPVTIPMSLINRMFTKSEDFKWVYGLSEKEKTAFNNWFMTGSPDSWGSANPAIQKLGLAGKIGAGSAQVMRRWLSLKLILGLVQTSIAGGLYSFRSDEKLFEKYPFLKDYLSIEDFSENQFINFWKNVWNKSMNTSYGFAIPSWTIFWHTVKSLPEKFFGKRLDEVLPELEDEIRQVENDMVRETPSDNAEQTQLEYTLDAVNSAAPEYMRGHFWESEGKIYYVNRQDIDCLITLEDGIYYIDTPIDGKIKLTEY